MPFRQNQKTILAAVITGAHGIKGFVKIKSFLETPQDLKKLQPLTDEMGEIVFEFLSIEIAKDHVIGQIKGIEDRNKAQNLKGTQLFILKSKLPSLDEKTFYENDLVGLDVYKIQENGPIPSPALPVAQILGVYNFGAGPLLEIENVTTKKTIFIPFTNDAVPHIYIQDKHIYVIDIFLVDL